MDTTVRLNEAFDSFTRASKSLETYYAKLSGRIQYLTEELERKNAELSDVVSKLRESKDFLHAVLHSIGEAIVVLDRDERITMMNMAAEQMFCLSSGEGEGRPFRELSAYVEEGNGGTVLSVRGNRYDVIRSRSTVCDAEGDVRGYVILIKDITALKEMERQNEMNSRLIAMGEMAAKIVHEIRSPLCSIELYATMLSRDLEGTPHADMSRGISTGIRSLNNILTNMLLFAKNQSPAFSEVGLDSVVRDSVNMLLPLMEARGVEITSMLNEGKIHGDAELLKQVVMNILINAAQAMHEGGRLRVIMGAKDGYITVSVIDEGEGIDPANVEKIFDPFFSTKEKGTGLGLTIAYKIMQCHNGFIRAFVNEDRGSTFCLYLPSGEKENNGYREDEICMKQ